MTSDSFIVFAGIAPHPPIMVPEIGREAISEVQGSIGAMARFTDRILTTRAETVIIVSPHAPLDATAFVAFDEEHLLGDFARFRAPGTTIEATLDGELLEAIRHSASRDGFQVKGLGPCELDHGTAVPLYFLLRNRWHGRIVALGYSFLSNEDHVRFGTCLQRAVDSLRRPVALVASGDLSHRLAPDAPAGYEPDAHLFDKQVVECISACEPARILGIEPSLRRLAGECGYRSMLVAFGATKDASPNCEVLNYEAPFGVGYMVAQLVYKPAIEQHGSGQPVRQVTETELAAEQLPALARQAVETYVRRGKVMDVPKELNLCLTRRAACFVSIKTANGNLRGCVGTVEPCEDSVAYEVMANAIKAATLDPRFPSVTAAELSDLHYSVDVLSDPELTEFEGLDPRIYGVIVEDDTGQRRGLLLPDLEGIESAGHQVDIASKKAGISPGAPLRFYRFTVERYREQRQ